MQIGILIPGLNQIAGAGQVAVHMLKALEDDHHIEVLCSEEPDWEQVVDETGVPLRYEEYRVTVPFSVRILRSTGRFFRVQRGYLRRYARKRDDLDIILSAAKECGAGGADYIHRPLWLESSVLPDIEKKRPDSLYENVLFDHLYPSENEVQNTLLICNSAWTEEVVQNLYSDPETTVVRPPVVDQFSGEAWDEREEGFVAVGRVHPSKRQHEMIEIIDKIRQEREVHLHILGEVPETDYGMKISRMASKRSYIHLEGWIPHREINRFLEMHKYGLHNHRFECYGIGVMEMVRAGIIPFVHDSGGPGQEFAEIPSILFENKKDAAKQTVAVVEDSDRQEKIRDKLQNIEINSPKMFRWKIKRILEDVT